MNTLNPWDQQPEEPDRWFGVFERFRLAGPKRSLLAVYNAERAQKNKDTSVSVPGVWSKNRQKWQWDSRARAWDLHLIDEERKRDADEREKARKSRKLTIRALTALLGRTIEATGGKEGGATLDPKELKDIAQAAATIMRESRLEFGEATDRPDVTTGGETLGRGMIDDMAQVFVAMREYEDTKRDED